MTQQIFVGYKLKPAVATEVTDALVAKYLATLDVPKTYAAEPKRSEWLEGKKGEWLPSVANAPYIATFEEVVLIAPAMKTTVTYKAEGREPGGKKKSVSAAARNFLLELYPNAWSKDTHPASRQVEVAFMGFNPRLFLKILGIECSLPVNNCPLPAAMWYGNTDHRDIEEAVLPTPECRNLSGNWEFIVNARRPKTEGDDLTRYNNIVTGWTGPGVNAKKDALLAVEWANQLGFIPPVAEKDD